jgi:hypothetical protein
MQVYKGYDMTFVPIAVDSGGVTTTVVRLPSGSRKNRPVLRMRRTAPPAIVAETIATPVTVRARDEDGRGIPRPWMMLVRERDTHGRVGDEQGTATVALARAGRYRLLVRKAGFVPDSRWVWTRSAIPLTIDVRLRRARS